MNKTTKGRIQFEHGYYEGDILDSKPNGEGKMIFKNGNIYDDNFINPGYASILNWDKPKGKGKNKKISWGQPQACVYTGIFKDGKPHGKGKMTYEDGDYYEGDFVEGHQTGKGIMVKTSIKCIYKGDFVNGLLNGNGIKKYDNGDIYEGEFYDNYEHGKGIYKTEYGVFEGEFIHGKRSKGKYTHVDGTVEEGNWCGFEFIGEETPPKKKPYKRSNRNKGPTCLL